MAEWGPPSNLPVDWRSVLCLTQCSASVDFHTPSRIATQCGSVHISAETIEKPPSARRTTMPSSRPPLLSGAELAFSWVQPGLQTRRTVGQAVAAAVMAAASSSGAIWGPASQWGRVGGQRWDGRVRACLRRPATASLSAYPPKTGAQRATPPQLASALQRRVAQGGGLALPRLWRLL